LIKKIIHRPANAIKELLENSLDGGSTLIQIVCKEGGMKSFTVTDNGVGIDKDDMAIVAERFTTSKLSHFSDLQQIQTFGFRGEALSSITHVAHLTITTRTSDSQCAYKASYSNGKLVANKKGAIAEPKPTAGNVGTLIQVEDLFYNVPTRKKALKNTAEEFNKILEVVQKYAIHNHSVGFVCKKYGSSHPDLQSISSPSVLDIIRTVYGNAIAKELLDFQAENQVWEFTSKGYISNANYNSKRKEFILFINRIHCLLDRLVDCPTLKKAVDAVFAKYLPKGTYSFSYIEVIIKPENIDVNVHPTKKSVHFLNEDKIVELICQSIDQRMKRADESRTFFIQTKIGTPIGIMNQPTQATQSPKTPAHMLVRTDSKARTLDSFIEQTPSGPAFKRTKSLLTSGLDAIDAAPVISPTVSRPVTLHSARVGSSGGSTPTFPPNRVSSNQPMQKSIIEYVNIAPNENVDQPCIVPSEAMIIDASFGEESVPLSQIEPSQSMRDWTDVELISIRELRQELLDNEHVGVTDIFKKHSFVGCYNNELALIQYQTDLMMVHFFEISAAFFYQAVLFGFSNFGVIHIDPIPIYELILLGIEQSGAWNESMLPKENIATQITDLFEQQKFMLAEYFCILISDGQLNGLPAIINGYVPNMNRVGLFLLGLGNHVDWKSEKGCFHDIAIELSEFYAIKIENDSMQQQLEHLIFAAMRTVVGQQDWIDKDYIKKVANLSDLYKIFERC
jgi:DNA mismatch repair protein MLH1